MKKEKLKIYFCLCFFISGYYSIYTLFSCYNTIIIERGNNENNSGISLKEYSAIRKIDDSDAGSKAYFFRIYDF